MKLLQIAVLTLLLTMTFVGYRLNKMEERADFHEAWLRVQRVRADQHEQVLVFILQKLGVK